MKKFIGIIATLMLALCVGMAQAAQIDGLQSNSGPALPTGLDVHVNPGGLGDALIAGYFNARGSFNFIRLVNTSLTTGVAVKVRFREGKYSNEVLDFFVCLSAGDQWTAWVYGDDDANNPGQILVWDDDTPTYPSFGSSGVQAFKYSSTGAAGCVTADMTKEGYFTVIGVSAWADDPGANKNVATTDQCGDVLGIQDLDGYTPPTLVDVGNVITGSVVTYDLADGAAAYGYNMLAMADFRSTPIAGVGLGLDDPPTFADCQDGIDGVNYILTKANLIAMYDIEAVLQGQSDIIVTFPTKTQTITAVGAQNPFQGTLSSDNCGWDNGCETVAITLWDDEENHPTQTHGFSPGVTPTLELCNEVNYITMGEGAASILNTDLLQFNLGESGYDIGWVNINFTANNASDRQIALPSAATHESVAHGLPSVGFELGSVLDGWYGHMLPLRYSVDIDNTLD